MSMYWILFIGFALLSWLVSSSLQRKFERYSQIPLPNGMTGKDVAEKMLHDNGIYDGQVTTTHGHLTDNYNQRTMNADYLYDDIQGMQPSAIWNIVKTSPNWAQCRDKIKTALVTEAYLEDFDYWISKNYRP